MRENKDVAPPAETKSTEDVIFVGTGEQTEEQAAEEKKAVDSPREEPEHVFPVGKVTRPEGRILQHGEPITFDSSDKGQFIVVQENVWREFWPHNSKRPSYVLVAAAGSTINKGNLQRMS